MSRDEPTALKPARGLSALGTTILVGLLAFLGGIAATAALIQFSGMGPFGRTPAPVETEAAPAEAVIAPPLPAGTDLATLNAREQMLAGRLDELEERLVAVRSASRVASSYANRAEGLLIAFATRRLLDRGLPLGGVEGQLRLRFGASHPEEVAAILRAANDPATLEDLRLALDAIAPRLVAGGPDEGVWSRVRRLFNDLVVLRQETSPSPRPADRLRRARRVLEAGQVEAALAEIAHLPGAESAESWIAAARRYIAARQALGNIELAAMQAPGAPPAPPSVPASAPVVQSETSAAAAETE